MMYKLFGKRLLDLTCSFVLIIILLPILLLLSLAIIIDTKGPVFFMQDRLGKNGKVFKIFKFRTMIPDAEKVGKGLFTDSKDNRITKVGKVLRNTSSDELPQLLNIIIGNMSFIGPRPPVPYYPYNFDEYPDEYKDRFNYRPGITGWAQVNGRTNISWNRRFQYDIIYHKKFSFLFDIRIMFKTFHKIISKESIYPDDIDVRKKHLKN